MPRQADVRFFFRVTDGPELEVVRFELTEGVSQPFHLALELASEDDAVDSATMLDREATLTIERAGVVERSVVGIVTAFEQGETGFRRSRYRAVVESPLARLALRHNSRIFQQVNATEILGKLLKESRVIGTRASYFASHEPREYCVQYRETDATFFHRLATEEGIVHWHDTRDGRDVLVLSDRIDSAPRLEDHDVVVYQPQPAGDAPGPHLWRFAYRRQLAPTRITQREYTFHNPHYDLQQEARAFASDRAVGDYEHYDYAARYKRDEAGKPFTRSKLSGLRNAAEQAHVEGDDARLCPGLAFPLIGHPTDSLNVIWRVIAMRHVGEQAASQEADAAGAEHGSRYSYEATVVPAQYDWKPEPAPRPIVDGPQIAHVVGPEGEEIHCDEHGRVQVWFPWDREGAQKENSTCWIRVSQGWAGAMYGFVALPRVGHEVIVSFLEGDPDQPIVTGRAYHAANRPPYELPRHKTRTTFKSQTHKGEGYNELRFEEEAGQEEIFVHAQKDQNIVVEHDETTRVGHDRLEDVGNDETISIAHDRKESVGNDETLSVGQDRCETLGRDYFLDIGRSRRLTVAKDLVEDVGNVRIERTAADRKAETGGHYEHKVAGKVTVEAGEAITQRTQRLDFSAATRTVLRGPGGTITLDGDGIRFDALQIRIKGPMRVEGGGAGNVLDIAGIPVDALSVAMAVSEQAQLESTFAFDQLTEVARRSTRGEFVLGLAPIFGFDIPADTYIKLHEGLRQGEIKPPSHVVMATGPYPADYDNQSRVIRVHTAAIERALKEQEQSRRLLAVLLHEFGHHVDCVLRHDLADKHPDGSSTLADDGPLDEGARYAYRIAFFDLENTSEVAYAHYTSTAHNGPLTVEYAQVQQALQQAQAGGDAEDEGKDGTREAFGAGRGEHHQKDPHGSFGHESIEDVLKEAGFTDPLERKQIYFGNWLRDYSQLIDPKIIRPPQMPKDLSRYISRETLTKLVDFVARKEFVQVYGSLVLKDTDPQYKAGYRLVTPERLGVYRPTEHIDNPRNFQPDPPDPSRVDPAFEPWAKKGDPRLEVVWDLSMKQYINQGATDYMRDRLQFAAPAGLKTETRAAACIAFGGALHVLEDYFAHSNFVELSLRKLGYNQVLAWTSKASCKHTWPVVTGMFGSLDVIASLAEPIAQLLFPIESMEFEATRKGYRSNSELMLEILLKDHGDPTYLDALYTFWTLRDAWASVPGHEYVEGAGWLAGAPMRLLVNAHNLVYQSLAQLIGNSVDDVQTLMGDPNTSGSTDPSHSQLAKDHDSHPFHTLAALLAKHAVRAVGKEMKAYWDGHTDAKPWAVAVNFIQHPNDSRWQDSLVKQWAKDHKEEIKRGSSATVLEHLHKTHVTQANERLRQMGRHGAAGWDYIQQNYEVLFGEKDQLARRK